jgi:hypothetical protein
MLRSGRLCSLAADFAAVLPQSVAHSPQFSPLMQFFGIRCTSRANFYAAPRTIVPIQKYKALHPKGSAPKKSSAAAKANIGMLYTAQMATPVCIQGHPCVIAHAESIRWQPIQVLAATTF